MNPDVIIRYIPPLFAIYLLWISNLSSGFLKSRVDKFVASQSHDNENADPNFAAYLTKKRSFIKALNTYKLVIQYSSLGWSTFLGFINATFVAIISLLTIFFSGNTTSLSIGVLTIVLLIGVFVPMFWWINSFDLDELVALRIKRLGGITPALLCKIVLTIFNLFLLYALYVTKT